MFTRAELEDAVNELTNGKHSVQNCEKLAAIYVVLDHLYGEKPQMNSNENEVRLYGNSKFLEAVAGKPSKDAWLLMDELVEAVQVFNPRLMNNFYEKLNSL